MQIFKEIILEFQSKQWGTPTRRDLKLQFVESSALSVVGVRRCGKTFRTFQFVDEISDKIPRTQICRIQFNDHRLRNLKVSELHGIDQAFYEIYPRYRNKAEVYFIFDELHRIDGWEDYVLYLLENSQHRVLITGSTSKLQTGKIASALRGKNLSVELLPFSFREFLRFKNAQEKPTELADQDMAKNLFSLYIAQGGMPGLLSANQDLHVELLQNYWDTMILRDVIEAHPDDTIRIETFSIFALSLVARVGCPTTIAKLASNLKAMGHKFNVESLHRYLHYLNEAFIVFPVTFYSTSEAVRNRNYQKIYCVDWQLANAVSIGGSIDVTRQLENIVYLELRRRGYKISYYKTRKGFEIDFIAVHKTKKDDLQIIQVCYEMISPEVRDRELRPIAEAANFFGTKHATIITFNQNEEIRQEGVVVSVLSAWKWLLDLP